MSKFLLILATREGKMSKLLKNLVDRLVALILLIVLSPLLITIAILVIRDSRGPAIFVQKRVGAGKRLFSLYKFRTMLLPEYSMNGKEQIKKDGDRITGLGNFLRRTSLDELPQLINILKGDMSLVGPRPTLLYQVERYNEIQLRRLDMKPGLTGLAQVKGRNSLSWEEKILYDVAYIENFSLWLDIKILFKTIKVVFLRRDIEFVKTDSISESDEGS
jgi:lipopolysaccharide/colanic/teichoic acid biosynthesis glycosyltransferase